MLEISFWYYRIAVQIKDWLGNKPVKQHLRNLIWQTNWFFLKKQQNE